VVAHHHDPERELDFLLLVARRRLVGDVDALLRRYRSLFAHLLRSPLVHPPDAGGHVGALRKGLAYRAAPSPTGTPPTGRGSVPNLHPLENPRFSPSNKGARNLTRCLHRGQRVHATEATEDLRGLLRE